LPEEQKKICTLFPSVFYCVVGVLGMLYFSTKVKKLISQNEQFASIRMLTYICPLLFVSVFDWEGGLNCQLQILRLKTHKLKTQGNDFPSKNKMDSNFGVYKVSPSQTDVWSKILGENILKENCFTPLN
jgi:hypothetical protein